MLCGPSDVVFKKPAILSFQHCAALKQGQWSLSVFYSDSAPEDPPNKQAMKITDLADYWFFFFAIVEMK